MRYRSTLLAANGLVFAGSMFVPAIAAEAPCFDDLAQLAPQADAPARGALTVPWFEWLPAVMPYNRPTSLPMVFTVRIEGGATSAQLTLSNGGGVVPLRDDGVAPDATAGDLVFSGNVAVQAILDRNTPERVHKPFIGSMQAFENGVPSGGTLNVFAFVMPPEAEAIPVTTVSAAVRTTPWLINLRDDAFGTDFLHERVVTNAIANLGDRYEFAHVVYGPRMYVRNRFHGRIRNNVTGIGLNTFDTGAAREPLNQSPPPRRRLCGPPARRASQGVVVPRPRRATPLAGRTIPARRVASVRARACVGRLGRGTTTPCGVRLVASAHRSNAGVETDSEAPSAARRA